MGIVRRCGRVLAGGLACAVSLWLAPGEARATDGSFICGRKVVMVGDSPADVIARCGPPTQRLGGSGGGRRVNGSPAWPLGSSQSARRRGEEVWIYDFGSRQLVRILYFAGGRLSRIEVGGYGG